MPKLYQKGLVSSLKILTFLCAFALVSTINVVFAQPSAPDLFKFAHMMVLGVAIIIGLYLIAINGYKIMMSQGDPRNVQEGREGFSSAIIGLLFVLLSVAILRVIIGTILGGGAPPF